MVIHMYSFTDIVELYSLESSKRADEGHNGSDLRNLFFKHQLADRVADLCRLTGRMFFLGKIFDIFNIFDIFDIYNNIYI